MSTGGIVKKANKLIPAHNFDIDTKRGCPGSSTLSVSMCLVFPFPSALLCAFAVRIRRALIEQAKKPFLAGIMFNKP